VRWITGVLTVLALAGCGGGTKTQAPSVSTPSDIVALMDTPRLTSLSSAGRVITAEGQATAAEGDSLRTEWFTTVGGVEYARRFGGSSIVRKVLHDTTILQKDNTEVGTLTDPATFFSEEDLRAHALRYADAAGVVVEEVNYVPFFSGTAEFVLRPRDESEFMSEFAERMYLFFRGLLSPGRTPVLVTIVDSSGANRLIKWFVPLSDEGTAQYIHGTGGRKIQIAEWEGMAWQARDLHVLDR
jgi:hypothetical protein